MTNPTTIPTPSSAAGMTVDEIQSITLEHGALLHKWEWKATAKLYIMTTLQGGRFKCILMKEQAAGQDMRFESGDDATEQAPDYGYF